MLYCRLIYMLSILRVRLTIKVKVGIPESFKVGWYPPPQKKVGRVTLTSRLERFVKKYNCQNLSLIQVPPRSVYDQAVQVRLRPLFVNKSNERMTAVSAKRNKFSA